MTISPEAAIKTDTVDFGVLEHGLKVALEEGLYRHSLGWILCALVTLSQMTEAKSETWEDALRQGILIGAIGIKLT
jgi:hypothetical protein